MFRKRQTLFEASRNWRRHQSTVQVKKSSFFMDWQAVYAALAVFVIIAISILADILGGFAH